MGFEKLLELVVVYYLLIGDNRYRYQFNHVINSKPPFEKPRMPSSPLTYFVVTLSLPSVSSLHLLQPISSFGLPNCHKYRSDAWQVSSACILKQPRLPKAKKDNDPSIA
jgi:hypothetical protein